MNFDEYGLNIRGAIGEEVRLEVHSQGTQHAVTYDLHEESRHLPESEVISVHIAESRRILSLVLLFSEPVGGAYDINVMGSKGDSYKHSVMQAPGQQSALLAFGLEGDPDEDRS